MVAHAGNLARTAMVVSSDMTMTERKKIMTTQQDIAYSYAQNAGTDRPYRRSASSNVSASGNKIYSYGWWPMAELQPDEDGNARGWWLVNGDTYSVTTTRHQSHVRDALAGTGMPMLIVPFSALESASVRHDSIRIAEVLKDSTETVMRTGTIEDVPEWMRATLLSGDTESLSDYVTSLGDGRYQWETTVHHLGESVFSGEVTEHHATRDERGNADPYGWTTTTRRAWFLSGFDMQEGFGLYFLAELPGQAETVADAYEMLKPAEVVAAEAAGLHVTRQGDVFAVPTTRTTRSLHSPMRMSPAVAGSHVVTEKRLDEELRVYGRGYLWHRPVTTWGTPRAPEHRRQRMGDGRTWHLMVKNTVPAGRSWSRVGNVD